MDFVFQDDDMFLAKILVPTGAEDVKVGSVVALIVDDAKLIAEVQAGNYSGAQAVSAAPAPAAAAAAAPAPAAAPSAAPAAAAAHGVSDASKLDANAVMPSARALMASHGVSSSGIKGTGKGGRITKADVLVAMGKIPASALAAPASAASPSASAAAVPASSAAASGSAAFVIGRPPVAAKIAGITTAVERAGGTFKETKPSTVRKVIASRLTESKAGIPHQYALMDCAIDAMLKLRTVLKDSGINVSVNDMVTLAAAKALKAVPEANCYYDPKSDSVKSNATIDISIAVATDGGLITPIVKGADKLGLVGINEEVKKLAGLARTNKLKPEQFQGGSFTISNLGMFGIDEFSAVINPPQACILAVGQGAKKVVCPPITNLDEIGLPGWPSKPTAGKGAAAAADASKPALPPSSVQTMMTVQLSSDARVVDPAIAGQFLQVFKHYVQNPTLLIA